MNQPIEERSEEQQRVELVPRYSFASRYREAWMLGNIPQPNLRLLSQACGEVEKSLQRLKIT